MWFRDPNRPVKWSKEGKLVYDDRQIKDVILQQHMSRLRTLVKQRLLQGHSHAALRGVCTAINRREKLLER